MERNILVESNLGLVGHIAKKFSDNNKHLEYEDAFSIGCVGLVKAANTFKVDKGFKFSTYAGRCISNELGMYLRTSKQDKIPDLLYMESPITSQSSGDDDLTVGDTIRGKDVDFMSSFYLEELKEKLTKRENEVFELYFEKDYDQHDVGKIIGICQPSVSRIVKRICNKYRLVYGGM